MRALILGNLALVFLGNHENWVSQMKCQIQVRQFLREIRQNLFIGMGCQASAEVYHSVPVHEQQAGRVQANQDAPLVTQEIKQTKAMNMIGIQQLTQILLQNESCYQLLSKENISFLNSQTLSLFSSRSNLQEIVDIYLSYIEKCADNIEGKSIPNEFWEKLAKRFSKFTFNRHFENLNALIVLGTTLKNKSAFSSSDIFDKNSAKKIFQVFRFGPCERDINAFAFLYMYLEKGCKKAERDSKSLPDIIKALNDLIEELGKIYPAAPPLPDSQALTEHPTYELDKSKYTQPTISLKGLSIKQKKDKIKLMIGEQIKEAERNLKDFKELITEPCQKAGFGLKMGTKVKNLEDKKNVDRVIEKLFKKELKVMKKNKVRKATTMEEYYAEENKLFEEALDKIYEKMDTLKFTITDMLRAKCLFQTVESINQCATTLKKRITENNYQLIEIDNRFKGQTATSDLVFKIKIGETITELQLAIKFNYVQNQFSHKIYEIARSTYYDTINFLRIYNETFSLNYAQKVNDMIEYNTKNIGVEQQKTIFRDVFKENLQVFSDLQKDWYQFCPSFPLSVKINRFSYTRESLKGNLSEQDEINIQKVKEPPILKKVSADTDQSHLINGIFLINMSRHKNALQELLLIVQPNSLLENKKYQVNFLIGQEYKALRQGTQALAFFQEAKSVIETKYGTQSLQYSQILNNLGQISQDLGRNSAALNFYRRALEIQRKFNSPEMAVTLNGMGLIYDQMRKFDLALECYNQCLLIDKQLGNEMTTDSAATLHNIGLINMNKGDYDEALKAYLKCLEIDEKLNGRNSVDTAETIKCIGGSYLGKGEIQQALKYYEQALQIIEHIEGPDSIQSATIYNFIAEALQSKFQYQEAIKYYQKCIAMQEKAHGKDSFGPVATMINLAELYKHIRKFDQAMQIYEKCLKITEKVHGRFSLQITPILNNMATIYNEQEEIQKSLDFYNECLQIQRELIGRDSVEAAKTLRNIGIFYKKLKYKSYAIAHLEQAFLIFDQKLGNGHEETVATAKLYKQVQDG